MLKDEIDTYAIKQGMGHYLKNVGFDVMPYDSKADIEIHKIVSGGKGDEAQKLFDAITEKQNIPLNRLIFALGIRHVGESSAMTLARHYGSWVSFRRAMENAREHTGPDWETLNAIDGIGAVMAAALVDFFHEDRRHSY